MIRNLLTSSGCLNFRKYSTALMRGVSSNLPKALSSNSFAQQEIDITTAIQQHDAYYELLKSIVTNIIHLEASDEYPDCVFIEDAAVAVDNKVVITNIGADSRKGEVDAVQECLEKMNMDVYDMRVEANDDATCDGGDVLYPVHWDGSTKLGGKHMFVGISSRTNQKGFEYLCKVFHELEVIPVHMANISNALHLKSITTHLDHSTLIMPTGRCGDELIRAMKATEKGYTVIRLPDIKACNIVSVNGHVIAQKCISDESKMILEREVVSKRGMKLYYMDSSEFAKCDGALTCKSILLNLKLS